MPRKTNKRKIWTDADIEKLIICLECGLTYTEIATKLKTTVKAVEKVVYNRNLSKHRKKPKAQPKSQISDILDLSGLSDEEFLKQKEQAKLNWAVPKSRVKVPKGRPYKQYIALYDLHIPHQNESAIKAVLSLMDDHKFDGIVLGGDVMDMAPISHWNKNKKKTLEKQRMKEDYITGNAILDALDSRLPKDADKHFLWGNHEDWYNQLIEEFPALEGFLEPNEELHMEERGYKTYQYNDIIQIGRLHFTHGIYAGQNPVKKHIDECKTNMMFGHVHSVEMKHFPSPARKIAMAGYSVGCLCDLSPHYMRKRPNNWVHGFAVIYFFEDGGFDVDLKRIVRGKFVYDGKVYDGNKIK